MNTPYTYLIGWSDLDTWYYGRQTAKDCHPANLWVTYFTSSEYVAEFRELHGEPDVVEVRKTFTDADRQTRIDRCCLWEEKVITKIGAVRSSRWLNKGNGGARFSYIGAGENAPRFIDTIFKWENIATGEVVEMTRYRFSKTHDVHDSHLSSLIRGKLFSTGGWKIHGTIKPPDKRPNKSKSMSGTGNSTYDSRKYEWINTKTGLSETMTGLSFREKYPEVSPSDISDLKKALRNGAKMSRKGWRIVG